MLTDLFQGEIISTETINTIFNSLNKQLLDRKEITLNFAKITFISVYFLERLEQFICRARDLSVKVSIVDVIPSVFKVFQIAKSKLILETCK